MANKINFNDEVNHTNLPQAVSAIINYLNNTGGTTSCLPPEPVILDNIGLCEKLNLSLPTLVRWRQKGKIPFMNIGASIRYDFNKVLQAIEVSKKRGGAYEKF